MALIIDINGQGRNVTPKNKKFNHKELNEIVGGYIEIIRLNEYMLMVINEEGKLQNLPHNKIATLLYHTYVSPYDSIVGNAVLVLNDEID